jgi:hypothetical protein
MKAGKGIREELVVGMWAGEEQERVVVTTDGTQRQKG